MREGFQPESRHSVQHAGADEEDITTGVPFHQDRAVPFLRGMTQATDAPQFEEDDRLPARELLATVLFPRGEIL